MKKIKQCLIEEDKLKNSALGNGGIFIFIFSFREAEDQSAFYHGDIHTQHCLKAVAWATTISCRYIRALGRDKGWVLQLR